MKYNSITIYDLDGTTKVKSVVEGQAIDANGNPIDEEVFGANKARVLMADGEYDTSSPLTITHADYLQCRDNALDKIKNDPELYAEYLKNNSN